MDSGLQGPTGQDQQSSDIFFPTKDTLNARCPKCGSNMILVERTEGDGSGTGPDDEIEEVS